MWIVVEVIVTMIVIAAGTGSRRCRSVAAILRSAAKLSVWKKKETSFKASTDVILHKSMQSVGFYSLIENLD